VPASGQKLSSWLQQKEAAEKDKEERGRCLLLSEGIYLMDRNTRE